MYNAVLAVATQVSCGGYACAARFADGSAAVWGNPLYGGDLTKTFVMTVSSTTATVSSTSATASSITATRSTTTGIDSTTTVTHGNAVDLSNDVADISCGGLACVARFTDGSAAAWGDPNGGGDISKTYGSALCDLTKNVVDISCGGAACAARIIVDDASTGCVWGDANYGGSIEYKNRSPHELEMDEGALDKWVADISCGKTACVARTAYAGLINYGYVWGDPDLFLPSWEYTSSIGRHVLKFALDISCGGMACAVRFEGNYGAVWGNHSDGGLLPNRLEPARCPTHFTTTTLKCLENVADISCGEHACVARFTSGSAAAWGNPLYGGSTDLTEHGRTVDLSKGVVNVSCGGGACVARFGNGSATVWGGQDHGGYLNHTASGVAVDLSQNVIDISCGGHACSALFSDGTAAVWGNQNYGGGGINGTLHSVANISCGREACAAVRENCTFAWGSGDAGGDTEHGNPQRNALFARECKATLEPTRSPTSEPTTPPTLGPTGTPTRAPVTVLPLVLNKTNIPTTAPTNGPSDKPTRAPVSPGKTHAPGTAPTIGPSVKPTRAPVLPGKTGTPSTAPTIPTGIANSKSTSELSPAAIAAIVLVCVIVVAAVPFAVKIHLDKKSNAFLQQSLI